jgi:quercetin dioxygenase-like cupin family protein
MNTRAESRAARPQTTPLARFDIAAEIARLKEEPAWRSGSRNAITLTKEHGLRVVLTVLHQGTWLHEHQASGPLTIQVLSGRLGVRAAGQSLTVAPGDVVALDRAVGHEVQAIEETAFLLTLAPTT